MAKKENMAVIGLFLCDPVPFHLVVKNDLPTLSMTAAS